MSANGSRVSLTDATNTNIYNNLITNGNLTTTGVLNIAGYSNVKTALDTLNSANKTITAASTLTIGTLRAGTELSRLRRSRSLRTPIRVCILKTRRFQHVSERVESVFNGRYEYEHI
jgi:uncharacterized protein (DUF302 family)